MQVPLQLSFRNVEKTEGIEALVYEQAAKLERVCDHITSCRVAIERMNAHQQSGSPFRVRIEVHVPPGHDLVVNHEPDHGELHDELTRIVRDCFASMKRQLRKLVELQQGETKSRAREQEEEIAIVVRVLAEEGYGFLQLLDGREIYFHRNSVINNDFDRVEVGTAVRFVEAEGEGEKGPQASTVQIVDKPGARIGLSGTTGEGAPLGW